MHPRQKESPSAWLKARRGRCPAVAALPCRQLSAIYVFSSTSLELLAVCLTGDSSQGRKQHPQHEPICNQPPLPDSSPWLTLTTAGHAIISTNQLRMPTPRPATSHLQNSKRQEGAHDMPKLCSNPCTGTDALRLHGSDARVGDPIAQCCCSLRCRHESPMSAAVHASTRTGPTCRRASGTSSLSSSSPLHAKRTGSGPRGHRSSRGSAGMHARGSAMLPRSAGAPQGPRGGSGCPGCRPHDT